MAKSKPDTQALADPTSDRVVLAYIGDVSARNVGTPARDLTAADLARLAYVEGARRGNAEGARPDPRTPDPEIVTELVALLERTGLYTQDVAAVAAAADTAPADPADTITEG